MGEAERLLALFESLPEAVRGEVLNFTEFLDRKADPLAWTLANAPLDDEPVTSEDEAAIAEAEADIAAGRLTSAEEMRAEFDLRVVGLTHSRTPPSRAQVAG